MKKITKWVLLLITVIGIATKSNAQDIVQANNTMVVASDDVQQIKMDTHMCPTLNEILGVNKTIEIWDLFPDDIKIIMAKGPHKDLQGFFIKRGDRWCILDIEKKLNPIGVVVKHTTKPSTVMLEYKNQDGLSHYKEFHEEKVVEGWLHIGKL